MGGRTIGKGVHRLFQFYGDGGRGDEGAGGERGTDNSGGDEPIPRYTQHPDRAGIEGEADADSRAEARRAEGERTNTATEKRVCAGDGTACRLRLH